MEPPAAVLLYGYLGEGVDPEGVVQGGGERGCSMGNSKKRRID